MLTSCQDSRATSKRHSHSLRIINPANQSLISEVPTDSIESISKKYEHVSTEGREQLRKSTLRERCDSMLKFKDLLANHENTLAEILSMEMGKPIRQSLNEIRGTQSRVQWFIDNVEEALEDKVVSIKETSKEMIRREPLGVISNISAWNYPYFVGTNVLVPALLTGNSVLYKPSEFATMTGLRMVDMLQEAGFSKSIASVIGSGDVGRALLDLDIQGVFFTGSYATGKKIHETVAPKLIKSQLELGGKDPVYVHKDVDIESVAEALVDGAMYNAGQSCCSVERIYVHENIYDAFVAAYIRFAKKLNVGNPMSQETDVGPLARREQISVIEDQIRDAVSKGAVIQCGGSKVSGEGNYFQPTVLTNVTHSMKVMREETFGPVVGIMQVGNLDEAVMYMNDTEYGLTSGIYTNREDTAMYVMERLHSGTVFWNRCDSVSNRLPWSGRKNSGIGLTLSMEGITAFTQPKAYNMVWK